MTVFRASFLLGVLALGMLGLKTGDTAPELGLPNQDGKVVRLADFPGKFVLIYFYPKDDTPGCTKEACSLRDRHAAFIEKKAVVLGVSAQDGKSHRAFREKHKLPFDLLVDADGKIGKLFGVDMASYGLHERKSVLVGPDRKIVRFYESVNPSTHAEEVLGDIAAHKVPAGS